MAPTWTSYSTVSCQGRPRQSALRHSKARGSTTTEGVVHVARLEARRGVGHGEVGRDAEAVARAGADRRLGLEPAIVEAAHRRGRPALHLQPALARNRAPRSGTASGSAVRAAASRPSASRARSGASWVRQAGGEEHHGSRPRPALLWSRTGLSSLSGRALSRTSVQSRAAAAAAAKACSTLSALRNSNVTSRFPSPEASARRSARVRPSGSFQASSVMAFPCWSNHAMSFSPGRNSAPPCRNTAGRSGGRRLRSAIARAAKSRSAAASGVRARRQSTQFVSLSWQ